MKTPRTTWLLPAVERRTSHTFRGRRVRHTQPPGGPASRGFLFATTLQPNDDGVIGQRFVQVEHRRLPEHKGAPYIPAVAYRAAHLIRIGLPVGGAK